MILKVSISSVEMRFFPLNVEKDFGIVVSVFFSRSVQIPTTVFAQMLHNWSTVNQSYISMQNTCFTNQTVNIIHDDDFANLPYLASKAPHYI